MRNMAKMFVGLRLNSKDVAKAVKGLRADDEDADLLLRELAVVCANNSVEADDMVVLLEKVRAKLKRYLRSM
jgi:hypothetical protein